MLDLQSFLHTREWWPADLLDEHMPPGRARPEAWLAPDETGVTLIHADDDEDKTVVATIEPGAEVSFCWQEDRGSVEITIMPGGAWKLDDPRDAFTLDLFKPEAVEATTPIELPPSARIAAATWFGWRDDYECQGDTMDELAEGFADFGRIEPEGLRITVDMGFWSDAVKFRVSADGRSLEPIDG